MAQGCIAMVQERSVMVSNRYAFYPDRMQISGSSGYSDGRLAVIRLVVPNLERGLFFRMSLW